MTKREFLAALRKTKGWKLTDTGKLRCVIGDCPILAVYRHRQPSTRYGSGEVWMVAPKLRLNRHVAESIVAAADNRQAWCDCRVCKDKPRDVPTVRAELLRACGLR